MLIGKLPDLFKTEEKLREIWSKPETREDLLKQLGQFGFDNEQIETLTEMLNAKDSDIFDVLAYISFDKVIATRKQRSDIVRNEREFFDSFKNEKAKDFLNFILERYEKTGVEELKREHLPELVRLGNLGTTRDAMDAFGNMQVLIDAYYKLQINLYKTL
jgi:type I restriction enzyme R subunit